MERVIDAFREEDETIVVKGNGERFVGVVVRVPKMMLILLSPHHCGLRIWKKNMKYTYAARLIRPSLPAALREFGTLGSSPIKQSTLPYTQP